MVRCFLVLEDESVMEGESFGFVNEAFGEVIFSTGMDGYQESLTDPSMRGQILVMTYPLIGNYGVSKEFSQSREVHARGLVVREYCDRPSNMYGGKTLDSFLKENRVPGISGVDTRELVIRIRQSGTMRGAIIYDESAIDKTIKMLKTTPSPFKSDLVSEVSPKKIRQIDNGMEMTIGMIDCGSKDGIISRLASRFNVTVFPYGTKAQAIIDSKVDGVMISNGPGDPSNEAMWKTVIPAVKELVSHMPIMGICYGNQILSLAMGGKTYKMKFGHRGCNQPVKYNDRVYVTSQNHGFAIDPHSLEGSGMIVNQVNINDGTVEGIVHRDLPVIGVQYHPEASPGPHDTSFLFDDLKRMMEACR